MKQKSPYFFLFLAAFFVSIREGAHTTAYAPAGISQQVYANLTAGDTVVFTLNFSENIIPLI